MSKIVNKEIDFSKWYTSVLLESEMFEYGLIKGTIIIKPFGFAIWENIQKHVNKFLKKSGTQNCMFPLFIPYSKFIKESKHIEGFAPELFKISKIENNILDDEYVIRPTSEIVFCDYFSSLQLSYNMLPIKLNQWCNAFRIEKNTRPFLRNSEFLWQEQHAIFALESQAKDFSFKMIKNYENFFKNYLCIDCLMGLKTEYEKFPGAESTYTLECFMQDGQALQSATSHYFGNNFSRFFDIKFQNKNNKQEYVFQTSAGLSTRLIGAIVLSHSDNNGLILPSKIAPYVIVFNIINRSKQMNKNITSIKNILKSFNYHTDYNDKSFSNKISYYETRGIPIQIIFGKKEFETNTIIIYRRDLNQKESINIEKLNRDYLKKIIINYDKNLFERSSNFLKKSIVEVDSLEKFKDAINNKKIVLANWGGSNEDEIKLKELTGASSRCIKMDEIKKDSKCFFTNKPANKKVYFARSY